MKILRLTSLLLLTLTAYVLPAPPPLAPARQPAPGGELGRAVLLRYYWLRHAELLDWLRERGPFTRPAPGLLPDAAASQ